MRTRAIIWSVLAVFLLVGYASAISTLAGAAAGGAIGLALAYYSARHTTFEMRGDGLWYRPQPMIGYAVFAIFLARFAYRMAAVYGMMQALPTPMAGQTPVGPTPVVPADPLTAGAFYLLLLYHVGYAVLLLRSRPETVESTHR